MIEGRLSSDAFEIFVLGCYFLLLLLYGKYSVDLSRIEKNQE